IRWILRLDPFPVLDRGVKLAGALLQVAELQARAHALAIRLQRRLEMLARLVGPRLRGLGGGELAVVLRELARIGADLSRHFDRAVPVLLLLVDLEQV